jgi:acetyl-CoA carboxylase biotin carboxyl carrier protein
MEVTMKIELVKQIIKEFENASIQKMKVEMEDIKLELEKAQQTILPQPQSTSSKNVVAENVVAKNVASESESITSGVAIKSPIVGVYYHANGPTEKPFVSVGDTVTKGQVVCIIEAMKVMNEIQAPVDGVVSAIMVKNDDLVEYDQVLMTIEG